MEKVKKFYFSYVLFCLALVVVTIVLKKLVWQPVTKPLVEAFWCFLILFAFLLVKEVREFLLLIPAIHRKIVVVFFFLIYMCQFYGVNRALFPLEAWTVFGRQVIEDTIVIYEYEAITREGKVIDLRPEKFFSSIDHGRFRVMLANRMENIVFTENEMREGRWVGEPEIHPHGFKKAIHYIRILLKDEPLPSAGIQRERIEAVLKAVLSMYNRKHPDQPVVHLDAIRITQNFYDREEEPMRQRIVRVTEE